MSDARPLPADPDEGAGEAWAALHVARNAHVAPEWADLRREVLGERDRLVRRLRAHRDWLRARADALRTLPAERILETARATEARDAELRDEVERAVVEVNAKVARHNLLVRVPSLQLASLTRERLLDLSEGEEEA